MKIGNSMTQSNKEPLTTEHYLTVLEIAEMSRVSKMTIYRLIESGKLPSVRFGSNYRVPKSAVENYIKTNTTGVVD
jgi:excisionase family DNA binding protein